MKLGFFYSCYKEKRAVEYSLSQLIIHYPESPIYLVSDGGIDFSYLKNYYSNLETKLDEDTMSATFKITDKNWKEEVHQKSIKKAVNAVLKRLEQAIFYCNTDYILMMDPDTLIRGILNIPTNVKLLGSRINKNFPQEIKDILLNIDGAKIINCWGATPAIFEANTFLKSLEKIKKNEEIIDAFINAFYAIYAHDVLIPLMFALVGEEETFNPDIVECNRDIYWESSNKPLVHQFKKFYEDK